MNVKFFDWDYLHLTALMKETYFSIYTKIYLIFFLALHAEFRVRVLRNVDFNLAKVIQDFFPSFEIHWYYSETLAETIG